ncbi:histidine kinase OS=Streptomyces alboniger OX=132473 GN=CP975_21990 PE=4 SV=1 [Streptomyces alboniger]
MIGGGTTGYMLKSLEQGGEGPQLAGLVAGDRHRARAGRFRPARAGRRDDRAESRCSGSGCAARRLGEGKLDTRLRVSGTDELADLSRTFNKAAEALEKRVADMAARDEASRRFVADMSP